MDSEDVKLKSVFTPAELTQMTLLWDRLYKRGVAPCMFYCIDAEYRPLVTFNPMFTAEEVSLLGNVMNVVMEHLNQTHAPK